jgi:hypothetical protein
LKFVWQPAAHADLGRLDRDTAMRILLALTRYGQAGEGDIKRLTDREGLYRLRSENGVCSSIWTSLGRHGFTVLTIAVKPTN